MSHANRGKPFEAALSAACAHYKGKRGHIRKRHARQQIIDGEMMWTATGDVDYSGDADGRAFYAEAKSTHEDALKLNELERRPHQLKKLASTAATGCMSGVIVGFLPEWSCWWLPWQELGPFLAAPWRRSINRNMCAAWGFQLPLRASPKGGPMVMFLDGLVSPTKADCIAVVNADRLAHPLELPLDEGVWKPRRRLEPDLPPPKTAIEAELRQRAGGLDPFHPDALRRAALKAQRKGRGW